MSQRCQHPLMNRVNAICTAPARFAITIDGVRCELNLYGARVGFVCGRHGNSVAVHRPGAKFEDLEKGATK